MDAEGKVIPRDKIHSIAMQAIGRALGVNCTGEMNKVMSCNTDFTVNNLTEDDLFALKNVYSYVRNRK